MKSHGLTLCLQDDPGKIQAYKDYHRSVWPQVLVRLGAVGVRDMKIFLRGRRMFMYIEAEDDFEPRRDFPRINEDPTSREWNELMATFQERAPEATPDEWWAPMEQVFDLSSQRPASA